MTSGSIFTTLGGYKWDWEEMCGPGGLHPWNPATEDMGYCFQRLFLHIPILFLLAISSAYYVGAQINWVTRGRLQENVINLRSFVILCLSVLPLLRLYFILEDADRRALPIDYFTCGTECLAWLVHFGFALALRHRLGISPRGPIIVLSLWSLTAVQSVISLRTVVLLGRAYELEIIVLVLQVVYFFTLIPSEGVTSPTYYSPCLVGSQYSQLGEQQPLLHSFIEDEGALGTALHGATFFSYLLFYWVKPLFLKGLEKKLKDPDDLFDLPVDLSCSTISCKIEKALIGNVDKYQSSPPLRVHERPTDRGNYGATSGIPRVEVLTPMKKFNVSLFRALHSCFAYEFYLVGILKLLADLSGFAGPLLLNKLVNFVEDPLVDVGMGYLYAGGLLASALVGAFCESHFNMSITIVSLKLRAAIISTVFRKALSVTSTELNQKFSIGEVTNFISTDTDRIVNSCPSFHAVWSIPLQLAVTLYLLYTQVGISFLAGLVFSIVLIPINKFVANKIGLLSVDLMHHKDNRVSLMTEIIKGIRTIKLHVWEDHFIDKVTDTRSKEMKYLKGRKYLDAICVFLWATTPVIVATLTLSTYALLGNKLTAATVFTSIALLNMLISPLNSFPWVLNGLTEAWVSVKRIQRLIDLDDLNTDHYYSKLTLDNEKNLVLYMKNATFTWGKINTLNPKPKATSQKPARRDKGKRKMEGPSKYAHIQRRDSSVEGSIIDSEVSEAERPFKLTDLTFEIERGSLVGIIGKVGSGKTSLLSAILAEMIKVNGEIGTSEEMLGFGYVSQKPWLQRGSIRDNILFGKAYEQTKYQTVLDACALTEDIAILGNDMCVGESGSAISGGQAARIALARAVYQDKQVYLLDDVLSAVDVQVGAHIYKKCIMGLLKYKTRIFVTHSLQYLIQANHIIALENGAIQQQGMPNIVLSEIDDFISQSDVEMSDAEGANTSTSKFTQMDNISLRDDASNNSMMQAESSAVGSVDFWVISMYWKSIGHWLGMAIFISLFLMQLSRNTTDLWLSYWVTNMIPKNGTNNLTNYDYTTLAPSVYTQPTGLGNNSLEPSNNNASITELIKNITGTLWNDMVGKITTDLDEKLHTPESLVKAVMNDPVIDNITNKEVSFYLSVFAGFAIINALFTLIRAFMFAYGGIHAAIAIHKLLLKTVMKGKMKFFTMTPAGRLLNRFSSDTYTVDDSLPFIMNILLAQVFGVIGSVLVTAYGLPWICLVIVPLIPIYHWLQHRYRLTSRELKRLGSVTLSPIYSHFNDTLEGGTVIKALGRTNRWLVGGEHLVERSQRASLCGSAAAQWLGLRLRLMGAAILAGAAAVAVAQRNIDFVDAGMVGLSISYALTVTSLLSGVINAFTETEREMIAVERVGEYIRQIEPEGYDEGSVQKKTVAPPYCWPNMGIICFNEVVMRYRAHLSPSLKYVTFECLPGEKIGVVGRTGAGKSSLFSALFRLCELSSGNISIDSVDISTLSLAKLRCRLAIIPQEPFIFSGSIRENLDPLTQYIDNELWNAVEKCGAKWIVQQRGGLQATASDLSRGHQQLLCLARAILHNAKILCIDEATANVDQETDRLIQDTIRCSFRKSTVITIAHRISTILDSDRVLVMGDGQVVEFDTPDNLMENPDSHFYQLMNQET